MPGMKWTPEADTRLFLTILAVQGIKVDSTKVAEALGECSPAGFSSPVNSIPLIRIRSGISAEALFSDISFKVRPRLLSISA